MGEQRGSLHDIFKRQSVRNHLLEFFIIRSYWLVFLIIGSYTGYSVAGEVTETLKTPDKVAEDIVQTFGDARRKRAMGVGTALSSRVKESKIVRADPAAYQDLAQQALATGNNMFVRALADARDGVKPPKKKRKRR